MSTGSVTIQNLASGFRISEQIVQDAQSIFKLAVGFNFTQGRTVNAVAAVCLYTACRRREDCRFMLIDFADRQDV